MAVEATHMNIFAPQFISNRECVKSQPNMNYVTQLNNAGVFPVTIGDRQLQYVPSLPVDPIQTTPAKVSFNKSESDLTYNFNPSSAPPPPTTTRTMTSKRPRDSTFDSETLLSAALSAQKKRSIAYDSSLIHAEFISQIQQQQSEIDRFIAQQTEKLRMELEARHRTQTRMLASAVQSTIVNKLKAKDDEIVRMGKLNWALQERVKSLYVETQIWRDLAQTNEATANNLRANLEQVLAQVEDFSATAVNPLRQSPAVVEDGAESSCGSCNRAEEFDGDDVSSVRGGCKQCNERMASVLVLPCRHLCLCTICGSSPLQACPVCDTVMNASVHVNMSSP